MTPRSKLTTDALARMMLNEVQAETAAQQDRAPEIRSILLAAELESGMRAAPSFGPLRRLGVACAVTTITWAVALCWADVTRELAAIQPAIATEPLIDGIVGLGGGLGGGALVWLRSLVGGV